MIQNLRIQKAVDAARAVAVADTTDAVAAVAETTAGTAEIRVRLYPKRRAILELIREGIESRFPRHGFCSEFTG